jgi:hypothetical protein
MTGQPDYSDVAWPWDGVDWWDAPREGATSDPSDGENWRLACKRCRLYFPKDIVMQTVVDHWVTQHHPEQADDPQLELDLVWVGLGTPPEPRDG